jgi:hypothetical protein
MAGGHRARRTTDFDDELGIEGDGHVGFLYWFFGCFFGCFFGWFFGSGWDPSWWVLVRRRFGLRGKSESDEGVWRDSGDDFRAVTQGDRRTSADSEHLFVTPP